VHACFSDLLVFTSPLTAPTVLQGGLGCTRVGQTSALLPITHRRTLLLTYFSIMKISASCKALILADENFDSKSTLPLSNLLCFYIASCFLFVIIIFLGTSLKMKPEDVHLLRTTTYSSIHALTVDSELDISALHILIVVCLSPFIQYPTDVSRNTRLLDIAIEMSSVLRLVRGLMHQTRTMLVSWFLLWGSNDYTLVLFFSYKVFIVPPIIFPIPPELL